MFQEGLHEFLKWDSKILDWMSVGLSALNGIPIIGEITDAASIALESEAQAAQVVDTAIQGGDMSLALKLAGINMAGAVVGAVGGPTARIGAKAVAKGVAEAAAKGTAKGVAKGAGRTAAERPSAAEFAKAMSAALPSVNRLKFSRRPSWRACITKNIDWTSRKKERSTRRWKTPAASRWVSRLFPRTLPTISRRPATEPEEYQSAS